MDVIPVQSTALPVSIIIPTWNEEAGIARSIESAACPFIEHEIIVVDAGSVDETVAIAERSGCVVVNSPRRQRAAQMNLGAARARGDVLLFLHADTRLQKGSLIAIREALRDPRVIGGAFARRYDSSSRVLAATCWMANWRNRMFGWHLGDQAIFARRHIFQRCGPFADADRFEDLDLSRRLGRCGRLVTLQPAVVSAARRFEKDGALLRTAKDLSLTFGYLLRGLSHPAKPLATEEEPLGIPPARPQPLRVHR